MAICRYLLHQHPLEDTLYPTDRVSRAKVERLLNFNVGTLYSRFGKYVVNNTYEPNLA